jgi:crossover junction endodeoxyribonuclease RusA
VPTLEPEFPLEFVVYGTPVSLQRANTAARDEWKLLVRDSCKPHLPEGHFLTYRRLGITLFYFPDGDMVGDVDNIVKYVVDALTGYVYSDDSQIDRLLVQRFDSRRMATFTNPSETLANCVSGKKPALYVRITDDPQEDL